MNMTLLEFCSSSHVSISLFRLKKKIRCRDNRHLKRPRRNKIFALESAVNSKLVNMKENIAVGFAALTEKYEVLILTLCQCNK